MIRVCDITKIVFHMYCVIQEPYRGILVNQGGNTPLPGHLLTIYILLLQIEELFFYAK